MTKHDSTDEYYFECWLERAMQAGDVLSYSAPQTYSLFDPYEVSIVEELKTKTKYTRRSIMREITYTPDFEIIFTRQGLEKYVANIYNHIERHVHYPFYNTGDTMVLVDVKPPSKALRYSSALGSSREFPIKQRLMWEEHDVFVNKTILYQQKGALFTKTFAPREFALKKDGKPRTGLKMKGITEII